MSVLNNVEWDELSILKPSRVVITGLTLIIFFNAKRKLSRVCNSRMDPLLLLLFSPESIFLPKYVFALINLKFMCKR